MTAAVVLAVLATLVAIYALTKWRSARDQASRKHDALTSRVTELQTVHAAGRELAATLDPQRIAEIVERECRKAFPMDSFFLGGCEDENGEIHMRAPSPLSDPLASWILREKRALLVDDAAAAKDDLPRPPFADGAAGSVLAVPLLVGERPVGIVSVHSATPAAFDEHHVAFLTTIAQQAAIALDSARRQRSATRDALTGLLLREEFLRRLDDEYVRAQRYPRAFSLIVLDLDGLKDVNARLDHAAGDRYLRELAATVRGRLRATDIGCRYGGDELAVLLPETEPAAARILAERLRQAVASLVVEVNGTPVRTTASLGIASHPTHDTGTASGLLARAEHAVHSAKRAGGNRVE